MSRVRAPEPVSCARSRVEAVRWPEWRVYRLSLVNVGIVESDPRPRLEPSPHDFGPSRPVPSYA